MVYQNILEFVGHTPVIALQRMVPADCARVLVKYEGLNVGGSIKTRTAWNMIQEAEQRGLLGPGSVIVEPTSGNQGIGLALVGAVRGYRTVIVMPDSAVWIQRWICKEMIQMSSFHSSFQIPLIHLPTGITQHLKYWRRLQGRLTVFVPVSVQAVPLPVLARF